MFDLLKLFEKRSGYAKAQTVASAIELLFASGDKEDIEAFKILIKEMEIENANRT